MAITSNLQAHWSEPFSMRYHCATFARVRCFARVTQKTGLPQEAVRADLTSTNTVVPSRVRAMQSISPIFFR